MHQATTMRLLAVVSLACTLTALGCTTNRTPASPTTTQAGNPPMASSSIPIDPTRPSSVDALAVLAADQAYQGRVLGKVNPDGAQSNEPIPPTGVFVNPALVVNPLTTVNSSISSVEIGPGVTSGAVGGVAVAVMTPATGATTVAATNSAIPSVSNAAIAATSNATIATVPAKSALATTTTTTMKASATKATASKATTARKKARGSKTVTTAQPVRLETNPTGDVVVTNTNPPKQ